MNSTGIHRATSGHFKKLMLIAALMVGLMSPGFSVTPERVSVPVATETLAVGVKTQYSVRLCDALLASGSNIEARFWTLALKVYAQRIAVGQKSQTDTQYTILSEYCTIPKTIPYDGNEELAA